jgi:hypothetical protein
VFVFEIRNEIQAMTKQLEACCSSPAAMCYWFGKVLAVRRVTENNGKASARGKQTHVRFFGEAA